MKLHTPGEAHKVLKPLVGTWDAAIKMYMPGASPTESKGSMVTRWILDGRFLEQQFQGDFGGIPFKGVGIMGHDNQKKRYIGSWMDSMTTSLMTMEGTYDPAKKTFTLVGECFCPIENGTVKMRDVLQIVDNDTAVQEMYKVHAGKEAKTMEIRYTRKK